MSKSTCSELECERPRLARGLCSRHYQRLKYAGKLEPLPDPRIACRIEGCEGHSRVRDLCKTHYKRLIRTGDPERKGLCTECGQSFKAPGTGPVSDKCHKCKSGRTDCVACGTYIGLSPRSSGHGMAPAPLYCSEDCKPRCSVSDCQKPVRKRGWCSNHYATWYGHGDPEAEVSVKWATEWRCLTCGNTDRSTWKAQRRQFCTDTCKVTWDRYGGEVPKSFICATCGVEVEYFDPETRRRLRFGSAYCSQCVRAARKYITAEQVAAEEGTDCKLCGIPVDMEKLGFPRWHPSVDHIVPRGLGGGDERENLQLSHRGCNSAKRHYYIK